MSLQLITHTEEGLLRVTVTGAFSLPQAKQNFLDIIDAVIQDQSGKILVDGRKVTGEPRTIERFLYGEFAALSVAKVTGRALQYAPQFAYVMHEPVLDPRRFGETVAVNRGMIVKVFDNMDDAAAWLGIAPGNESKVGHR